MKKVKLAMDELRVESFVADLPSGGGTVNGHEGTLTCPNSLQPSCDPEGYTCYKC